MKARLFFLMLIFANLMLQAQDRNDKTPFLAKSLANESIRKVQVSSTGGNISVSGVSSSEARVEVYVWPSNSNNRMSDEEIKKRLDEDYELSISVEANTLTAIAKPKFKDMNWKKSLSISFKVFVPQNISTHLRTSGGSISLKNISGNQDFSTSGGSLHIDQLSGQIQGRTSGGSIDISNSRDEIDMETSGGSIEASNCSGNVTLTTSGGSLYLKELQGTIKATTSGGSINGNNISGSLRAHTSGGNVYLSELNCGLETSTSGGNIDVAMKGLSKEIRIDNSGGNISLEIPKNKGADLRLNADKITMDSFENFAGSKEDDQVNGKLNGGGVPVVVKAGSGRIHLSIK